MIINVTGGPDLSLIEVSEASTIIQEAAHEDANIIFGAVVDPALERRVKITVIATGFDRAGAMRSPSATPARRRSTCTTTRRACGRRRSRSTSPPPRAAPSRAGRRSSFRPRSPPAREDQAVQRRGRERVRRAGIPPAAVGIARRGGPPRVEQVDAARPGPPAAQRQHDRARRPTTGRPHGAGTAVPARSSAAGAPIAHDEPQLATAAVLSCSW